MGLQFSQTLAHTEKIGKPFKNVFMVFHRCSVFFQGNQEVYKIVQSVLFTFLTTIVVYSTKKTRSRSFLML